MQKTFKIAACLLVALIFGAGASATFRAAMEAPEITNWRRTGELRFDRPVLEEYARRINQEVRAEILRRDMIRRSKISDWQIFVAGSVGYLAGMLLDPLLLAIEAIAFAVSWAVWSRLARSN